MSPSLPNCPALKTPLQLRIQMFLHTAWVERQRADTQENVQYDSLYIKVNNGQSSSVVFAVRMVAPPGKGPLEEAWGLLGCSHAPFCSWVQGP